MKSYEEEIKTIPSNFNEKKVTCKTQSFDILLVFLLITTMNYYNIIDSCFYFSCIYCYLIKICIDSIN